MRMRTMSCAVAVLGLLLPAGTAEAGPADKLPALPKVQALFPDVTELQASTGGDFEVQQDCLTYTTAAHAKKTVTGYYPGHGYPGPGGGRRDSANVFVYKFKNQHRAKKALDKVKSYVQACTGSHADPTTTATWLVTPLADPSLADHSLAYSARSSIVFPPSNVVLSDIAVHVVVQRDDRVVDAFYDTSSTAPDVATVTKLAKLALKSSA